MCLTMECLFSRCVVFNLAISLASSSFLFLFFSPLSLLSFLISFCSLISHSFLYLLSLFRIIYFFLTHFLSAITDLSYCLGFCAWQYIASVVYTLPLACCLVILLAHSFLWWSFLPLLSRFFFAQSPLFCLGTLLPSPILNSFTILVYVLDNYTPLSQVCSSHSHPIVCLLGISSSLLLSLSILSFLSIFLSRLPLTDDGIFTCKICK